MFARIRCVPTLQHGFTAQCVFFFAVWILLRHNWRSSAKPRHRGFLGHRTGFGNLFMNIANPLEHLCSLHTKSRHENIFKYLPSGAKNIQYRIAVGYLIGLFKNNRVMISVGNLCGLTKYIRYMDLCGHLFSPNNTRMLTVNIMVAILKYILTLTLTYVFPQRCALARFTLMVTVNPMVAILKYIFALTLTYVFPQRCALARFLNAGASPSSRLWCARVRNICCNNTLRMGVLEGMSTQRYGMGLSKNNQYMITVGNLIGISMNIRHMVNMGYQLDLDTNMWHKIGVGHLFGLSTNKLRLVYVNLRKSVRWKCYLSLRFAR